MFAFKFECTLLWDSSQLRCSICFIFVTLSFFFLFFVNVAIWCRFFFVYVQNLVFLCSFTCLTLEFADIRLSCVFQFQFTRLLFRRSQVNCRGDFFFCRRVFCCCCYSQNETHFFSSPNLHELLMNVPLFLLWIW